MMIAPGCGSDATPPSDLAPATTASTTVSSSLERQSSSDNPSAAPSPEPTQGTADGVIEPANCPSDASCADEISLNGRVYQVGCLAIDDAEVDTDSLLGEGRALGRELQAFALFRVPDASVIALSVPQERSGCDDNSLRSPWAFAALSSADLSILCSIGLFTEAQALNEGCPDLALEAEDG